ncbi:MAG: hypothetical protein JSW47_14105 [Phycisphaerales bacterium]|nr:MAG: hypothetical protein JSW47_14105 [Phycisphaerales bacterium]
MLVVLGIAVLVATVALSAYCDGGPWLGFWEHIGEAGDNKKDKPASD